MKYLDLDVNLITKNDYEKHIYLFLSAMPQIFK
jgi:hypothetical protein